MWEETCRNTGADLSHVQGWNILSDHGEIVGCEGILAAGHANALAISLLPKLVEALRKALVAIDLLGPPQEPYGEVFMAEERALLSRIDGEQAGEVG